MKHQSCISVLVLTVLTPLIPFIPLGKAAEEMLSFGYPCNETSHCDLNRSLTCQSGSCACRNPSTAMMYDLERATCVVLANKSCLVEIQVSLTMQTAAVSLGAPGQRQLLCVKNANCHPTLRVCLCDELLMPSENGTCIPKKLLNASCSTTSECRQDLGLVCSDKVCKCDLSITVYDETESVCRGLAEKPCIKDKCTANAKCVDINEGMTEPTVSPPPPTNVSSTSTTRPSTTPAPTTASKKETNHTFLCTCTEDYNPTLNGRCAKDFGIKCDRVRQCKPWLRCGESGACECLYPNGQVYDEFKGTCVSLVNSPCNTNFTYDFEPENNTVCIYGGGCVKKNVGGGNSTGDDPHGDLTTTHHCQCMEGFVVNEERGCDLGIGKQCLGDSQTGDDVFKCDSAGKLSCKDDSCQCVTANYEYHGDEMICRGLVGASCNLAEAPPTFFQRRRMNKTVTNATDAWEQSWCTKGARCMPLNDGGSEGTCQCISRGIGKGKCSDKDLPVMLIIGISVGAIASGIMVIGCFFYIKKKGFVAANAMS